MTLLAILTVVVAISIEEEGYVRVIIDELHWVESKDILCQLGPVKGRGKGKIASYIPDNRS